MQTCRGGPCVRPKQKGDELTMIEVKNLKKVFQKEIRKKGIKGLLFKDKKDFIAVNDISFSINQGEIVAFVGPNGAGKSTTIKMLQE